MMELAPFLVLVAFLFLFGVVCGRMSRQQEIEDLICKYDALELERDDLEKHLNLIIEGR